jgi:hypothetical protein
VGRNALSARPGFGHRYTPACATPPTFLQLIGQVIVVPHCPDQPKAVLLIKVSMPPDSLLRLPLILSCSRSLCGADVFFAMPTKPVAKKPIPGKPQAGKPAQKNVVQKKPAPDKAKGLSLLKETLQASFVQKKSVPKSVPDKVENLAKEYLPNSERLM